MIDTTTGLAAALARLADEFEVAASLEPPPPSPPASTHAKPGSRLPPGMNELIEDDARTGAIDAVHEWAEFLVHVLIDEVDDVGYVPEMTPGRLRLAAQHAGHFIEHEDVMIRYDVAREAEDHLRAVGGMIRRASRRLRTGSACMTITCGGEYVATLSGPDVTSDVVCSACGDRVPQDQWERWGARAEWVTVEKAASMTGRPVSTVRVWAHRYEWQRTGTGRNVRYLAEDVKNKREKEDVA